MMQANPALRDGIQCRECYGWVASGELHWYTDCIIEKVRSFVHGMDSDAVGRQMADEIVAHINYMRSDGAPPHPKDVERDGAPA